MSVNRGANFHGFNALVTVIVVFFVFIVYFTIN